MMCYLIEADLTGEIVGQTRSALTIKYTMNGRPAQIAID
jgi:hypothetical protein